MSLLSESPPLAGYASPSILGNNDLLTQLISSRFSISSLPGWSYSWPIVNMMLTLTRLYNYPFRADDIYSTKNGFKPVQTKAGWFAKNSLPNLAGMAPAANTWLWQPFFHISNRITISVKVLQLYKPGDLALALDYQQQGYTVFAINTPSP